MNKETLSVTFVLPGLGNVPSGGPKVVYEYANALVAEGHQVAVVHPAFLAPEDYTAMQRAKRALRYIQRSVDKSYRPDPWFKLDPRVQTLWTPSLHSRHIPDADIVVATWCRTAEWVATYPRSKGEKFYLLQHLETWEDPESRVLATWRLPLRKIVIAKWLQAIATELGEDATYIPNGLNFDAFGVDVAPEARDPDRVMMLYHDALWKGSADGLAALERVHRDAPALNADLFGVGPGPENLPPWIRYHRNPPQPQLRQLYNQAAIFLSPSWAEGWPLPPAEAMMSGCAVVATNIGGHQEYCIHEQTALLSPPKDPGALAIHLGRLLKDPQHRILLAHQGHEHVQQFTWSRATASLETAFFKSLNER